jgi:hypothetical protein
MRPATTRYHVKSITCRPPNGPNLPVHRELGIDERRFLVLDAADNRVGDYAYFQAIADQMENGGLAAMIHDMLQRDVSKFQFRNIPQTDALKTQKTLSLGSIERWWLTVLSRGFLWKSRHGAPWFGEWHEFYSTELLERSYLQWCEAARPYDRKNRVQLGHFFTRVYTKKRPNVQNDKIPIYEIESVIDRELAADLDQATIVYQTRPHGYQCGELSEARIRFRELYDINTDWSDD